MCVIIHCDIRPTDTLLEMAEKKNPDGIGIGWFSEEDGERWVRWEKGLTLEEASPIVENIPLPFVVHFRKTTAGSSIPELCHPFPITDDATDAVSGRAKRILFHNGTISKWDDVFKSFIASLKPHEIPDTEMSDSRAAAFMVHHLGAGGEKYLRHLGKTDTNSNRFLVMDADDEELPVRRWGNWYWMVQHKNEDATPTAVKNNGKVWESGLVFSNTYWKPGYTVVGGNKSYGSKHSHRGGHGHNC